MPSPAYIGQVMLFAGDYAPEGWVFCDGRLLNIAEYTRLFELIGATYGGDGSETFAVPDLRERIPAGPPVPTPRPTRVPLAGGAKSVSLTKDQLPPHAHTVAVVTLKVAETEGTLSSPAGAALSRGRNSADNAILMYAPADAVAPGSQLAEVEGGLSVVDPSVGVEAPARAPISIEQPYILLNYLIAVDGVSPLGMGE